MAAYGKCGGFCLVANLNKHFYHTNLKKLNNHFATFLDRYGRFRSSLRSVHCLIYFRLRRRHMNRAAFCAIRQARPSAFADRTLTLTTGGAGAGVSGAAAVDAMTSIHLCLTHSAALIIFFTFTVKNERI